VEKRNGKSVLTYGRRSQYQAASMSTPNSVFQMEHSGITITLAEQDILFFAEVQEKAKDFIIAQFAARGREMDLEAKRAFNALRPDITGKHELSLEDTLP
jgi:hypothetical protein